jgi:hypothetical protein
MKVSKIVERYIITRYEIITIDTESKINNILKILYEYNQMNIGDEISEGKNSIIIYKRIKYFLRHFFSQEDLGMITE